MVLQIFVQFGKIGIIDGTGIKIKQLLFMSSFYFFTGVPETFGQPSFTFEDMTFNDGLIKSRTITQYSRLYIQEGAVVEITCKSARPDRESLYSTEFWYGVWFLDYDTSTQWATQVDSTFFRIQNNWERYHSTDVESGTSLDNFLKFVSTLKYVARLEDNGKYLQCRTAEGSTSNTRIINTANHALVVLIVRRKFLNAAII